MKILIPNNLITKIINIGRETDRESPQVLSETEKSYIIKATKSQLEKAKEIVKEYEN